MWASPALWTLLLGAFWAEGIAVIQLPFPRLPFPLSLSGFVIAVVDLEFIGGKRNKVQFNCYPPVLGMDVTRQILKTMC